MIYRALVELAEREKLDTAYEPQPLDFIVSLVADGRFVGLIAPRVAVEGARGKSREQPVERPVPRRTVRSGTRPPAEFLVDNPRFVFGLDPRGELAETELARRREAFRHRAEQALEANPGSPGLAAVSAFLKLETPKEIADLLLGGDEKQRRVMADALFGFELQDGGGGCVHDEAPVKRWFSAELNSRAEGLKRGQCLVSGEEQEVLTRLHACPKGIPPISKTKGGVPLTSVNAAAFVSYGMDDLGGAPISLRATLAIDTALSRLLHPAYLGPSGATMPKRCVHLSADTAVVYWTKEEAALDFVGEIEEADPGVVQKLLTSPGATPAPVEDVTPFYALVLGGMTGRGVVRSYLETTVKDVAERVLLFQRQAELIRPWGAGPGGYSLGAMRRAIAVRQRSDVLPPSFATELLMRVLDGRRFSQTVISLVVRRNRAELLPLDRRGRPDVDLLAARCCLLKAFLNRNLKAEVPMALDRERPDTAYRLGRLLAIMERAQRDAQERESLGTRSERVLNATVVDRFYGAASATPAVVFPALLRRFRFHIAKIRRDSPERWAPSLERAVDEVVSSLSKFPATLDLAEQGLFALGYYHQRQDFFTKKGEN